MKVASIWLLKTNFLNLHVHVRLWLSIRSSIAINVLYMLRVAIGILDSEKLQTLEEIRKVARGRAAPRKSSRQVIVKTLS